MKGLEKEPIQSENEQNLPSSGTGAHSLLSVASQMKDKVMVGDASKNGKKPNSKIPNKGKAKAKPKSKPLLQKNPVYRRLSNKKRMQLTSPNQKTMIQQNMNHGLEFLQICCANIVLVAPGVGGANIALARVGTTGALWSNFIAIFFKMQI